MIESVIESVGEPVIVVEPVSVRSLLDFKSELVEIALAEMVSASKPSLPPNPLPNFDMDTLS